MFRIVRNLSRSGKRWTLALLSTQMHENADFSRAYPSFFAIVSTREWRRTSINPVRFRRSKEGFVQEVSCS